MEILGNLLKKLEKCEMIMYLLEMLANISVDEGRENTRFTLTMA